MSAETATAPAGFRTPRRLTDSTLLRHLAVAVGVGIVLILVATSLSAFRDFQLAQAAMYTIAVAGLTLLTGTNGQVSLGHGAFMAVGAYTTALLLKAEQPSAAAASGPVNYDAPVSAAGPASVSLWTLLWILLVAIAVTAAVGLVMGAAAARLRGPYLAGVTLAFAVAVPSLADRYTSVFKGDQGLPAPLPPSPGWLGHPSTERWQAILCIVCAAIVLVLLANLLRSRLGRVLRAVRDDEISASLAGLSVPRLQVLAFVISAACTGLAGALLALLVQRVSPGGFALTLSLSLVTAAVIGGLGSLAGAVWGALALVFLPELSSSITDHLNVSASVAQRLEGNLPLAIYGFLLIVVMLVAPGGIQGLVRRATDPLRARIRATNDDTTVQSAP
jgi:branched-chain amino acid transport system permease protein